MKFIKRNTWHNQVEFAGDVNRLAETHIIDHWWEWNCAQGEISAEKLWGILPSDSMLVQYRKYSKWFYDTKYPLVVGGPKTTSGNGTDYEQIMMDYIKEKGLETDFSEWLEKNYPGDLSKCGVDND